MIWIKISLILKKFGIAAVMSVLIFLNSGLILQAQPEVMAWGNMTGIRVSGQLMEFETSLRVVERGWLSLNATGKERQQPKYDREGTSQTVNTSIRGVRFSKVVDECGTGCAEVRIKTTADRDYSVLTGGGVFGTQGSLQPTQRFWNLRQLASTPENAFSIPFTCSRVGVNCAAFASISRGEYAVHIVNNGAECQATVKGIPFDVKLLEIFVTDSNLNMQKTGEVKVVDGTAVFKLHTAGFTTLSGKN